MASEAGKADSEASIRSSSKFDGDTKSERAVAEAPEPSWLAGIINSIKKPKQAEPPPPPPYPLPDAGSAQPLRVDVASNADGGIRGNQGDQGAGVWGSLQRVCMRSL